MCVATELVLYILHKTTPIDSIVPIAVVNSPFKDRVSTYQRMNDLFTMPLRPDDLMKILVERLSMESFRFRVTLLRYSVGLCLQQMDK